MASVPNFQQQVLPGNVPGVRAPDNFGPQDFGGNIARVVQNIGVRVQYDQDKAAAYKVAREARLAADRLWTGEGGGRWKKGEEFLTWAGKDAQEFMAKLPSGLEKLTPGARSFAEPMLNDVADSFNERIGAQAGEARIELFNGHMVADIKSISDSARLGATDPRVGGSAVARGLEEGGYRIFEYANDHPELIGDLPKDEWVATEVRKYESGLVRDSIDDALAAGQVGLAQEYGKLYGDKLLPDDKNGISSSLAQASSLQEIADVYDFLQTGMPLAVGDDAKEQVEFEGKLYRPPAAQIEAWLKDVRAIGKRKDWSAKQIEDAVEYTRRRAQEDLDIQRAKQDEMAESIAADLEASGGDMLDAIKRRPAAFRFIGRENRALVAKSAAAVAGQRTEEDEMAQFLGFVQRAEKDPQGFAKISEFEIRSSVDDAHAKTLLSMREGKAGGLQSAYQVLAQRTKDMSDGDKIEFTNAAEAMWADAGGVDKLGNVELGKRLDAMMADRALSGWGQLDHPAYKMDVSDVHAEDINPATYQKLRLALAGELPAGTTPQQLDEAVKARYLSLLRAGLYDADGNYIGSSEEP